MSSIFFFNATATAPIYTLSLHDALPICKYGKLASVTQSTPTQSIGGDFADHVVTATVRSEEHTSELQSHVNLVCRLLLEKKKLQQERTGLWIAFGIIVGLPVFQGR